MKRREATIAAAADNPPFPDAKWSGSLVRVCEYLTHGVYEDGTPRDLSTVAIKYQDGGVCVALNDPDTRASLYVWGETVEKALKALEARLGDANADWRPWGGGKKQKKA